MTQMLNSPPTTPAAGEQTDSSQAESSTGDARQIVFVVGSGRSGSSTITGTLKQLGMHVPLPEVQADESNPKGFAESQWVVDFHNELLRHARVHVSDARPQAWFETARVALRAPLRDRLDQWLESQFSEAAELVIKDPRLVWFIAMWRASATRSAAEPAFVTMLRPPTEVISSKETYYGGKQGNASRTVAWINLMLHTERATRDSDRVFLRYHDLLSDWTSSIYRLGESLDLRVVKNANTDNISRVHKFIDPSLARMRGTWDDLDEVPVHLRELAEETYKQLNKLADNDHGDAEATAALDELRLAYTTMYSEAEAITRSSITAARLAQTMQDDRARAKARRARLAANAAAEAAQPAAPSHGGLVVRRAPAQSLADRIAGRIPHEVRAKLPAGLRHGVRALLDHDSKPR